MPWPLFFLSVKFSTGEEGMQYTIDPDPDALIRGTAQVGHAAITVCTDGTARFDGGAMFGVVPKALWQQRMPADELNRVEIGLNCVVVRIGGYTVLIETGFGNKLSPKLQGIYATRQMLPQSLAAAGIAPCDVTHVVNTHLHWDHCGWNTVVDGSTGETKAFFPNAQYLVHQGEVDHGRQQYSRDRVSYVAANYEPLLASGQMKTIAIAGTETYEVVPGVTLECFPGHTAQMLAVHIRSGGEHACFVSDLVPTAAHLDETWVMAFDLDPLRCIAERRRMYARALAEQWLVLFPHDHARPMAELTTDERGAVVVR